MEADRKQKRCARSITIARAVFLTVIVIFILLHRQRGDTLNDDKKSCSPRRANAWRKAAGDGRRSMFAATAHFPIRTPDIRD